MNFNKKVVSISEAYSAIIPLNENTKKTRVNLVTLLTPNNFKS